MEAEELNGKPCVVCQHWYVRVYHSISWSVLVVCWLLILSVVCTRKENAFLRLILLGHFLSLSLRSSVSPFSPLYLLLPLSLSVFLWVWWAVISAFSNQNKIALARSVCVSVCVLNAVGWSVSCLLLSCACWLAGLKAAIFPPYTVGACLCVCLRQYSLPRGYRY